MSQNARALVSIASDRLSADIDPLGSQLHAIRDEAGRDLQWDGDPKVWSGRAPILFPIVGMLNNGRYRVGGETYALPKHGFARHKPFRVVEAGAAHAVFRLTEDEETLKAYPFRFQLDIRFAIEATTLTLTARVHNPGEAALPASFGFHPALRWPLPYGEARDGHVLTFEADEPAPIRRIDREGLLTPKAHPTPVEGRTLTLKDALFEDDALIFDRLNSRKLRYHAGGPRALEIAFPDTPYLGVWTKPGADYICVEPWHGMADPEGYDGDLFDKPGIFSVAPGAEKVMSLSITLAGT